VTNGALSVFLKGQNDQTLQYVVPGGINSSLSGFGTWHSFSVPFTPASWRDTSDFQPPTAAQMKHVLRHLKVLDIETHNPGSTGFYEFNYDNIKLRTR
jgi:hypothetical protein